MAWISVHEQLKDHRKVRELARLLGCSRHEALGILVTLWLWGINNADRDGNLGSATGEDIATGTMYRGDSKLLSDSLLTSGWMDEKDGCYVLHDWDVWQQQWFKALDRRDQSKQLMRDLRGKRKKCDVSKQLAQQLTDSEHNVSNSPSPKPSPKPSYKTETKIPPHTPPVGEGRKTPCRKRETADREPEDFVTFWACYPKKVAKPAALRVWNKLNPDEDTVRAIIHGLSRAKLSEQWKRDNGQYIPHPTTWLNQRRWEDEDDNQDLLGAPTERRRNVQT